MAQGPPNTKLFMDYDLNRWEKYVSDHPLLGLFSVFMSVFVVALHRIGLSVYHIEGGVDGRG